MTAYAEKYQELSDGHVLSGPMDTTMQSMMLMSPAGLKSGIGLLNSPSSNLYATSGLAG